MPEMENFGVAWNWKIGPVRRFLFGERPVGT